MKTAVLLLFDKAYLLCYNGTERGIRLAATFLKKEQMLHECSAHAGLPEYLPD